MSAGGSKRRVGLVGLPNVGKSTLFNLLTRSEQAEAMNIPFCTIEPNIGRVAVIDRRLRLLARNYKSKKIVAHEIEFVDIAGLVPGASEGAGLGNQFLNDVRDTKVILHVIRCFENSQILNTQETVDPVRDIALIENELILADLFAVEKKKGGKVHGKGVDQQYYKTRTKMAADLKAILEDGQSAKVLENSLTSDQKLEKEILQQFGLLSLKPQVYVCNVDEGSASEGNQFSAEVIAHAGQENTVVVSAAIEAEAAQLSLEDEEEFLQDLGLTESGLERVSRSSLEMLGLDRYYSCGQEMSTVWLYPKGSTAEVCAGVIHAEIAQHFYGTLVIRPDQIFEHGTEEEVIRLRKHRNEGKDYLVQDGDILSFQMKQQYKKGGK